MAPYAKGWEVPVELCGSIGVLDSSKGLGKMGSVASRSLTIYRCPSGFIQRGNLLTQDTQT